MAREQINDSSKNQRGSWDAYKLVREYVGIAWMLNFSEQLENLPWDNQVRVQRVASAICAFLSIDAVAIKPYDAISMVFSNYENKEVLKESQVCESDRSKIKSLLCQMSHERWRMEHLLKSFSVDNDRTASWGFITLPNSGRGIGEYILWCSGGTHRSIYRDKCFAGFVSSCASSV